MARRPIADFAPIQRELEHFVFRSGQLMRPVFEAAKQAPRRIVYAEGEEERVLRAVQTLVDEGLAAAHPDRPPRSDRSQASASWACGWISPARCSVLDPEQDDSVFGPLLATISSWSGGAACRRRRRERSGSRRHAIAAAMLLDAGEVDAAICGGFGDWWRQIQYILPIIPRRPGVSRVYSLSAA